jgi:hypothetical protein
VVAPWDRSESDVAADHFSDADAEKVLATIEKEIHRSPNWARYAMNALPLTTPLVRLLGSQSPSTLYLIP